LLYTGDELAGQLLWSSGLECALERGQSLENVSQNLINFLQSEREKQIQLKNCDRVETIETALEALMEEVELFRT